MSLYANLRLKASPSPVPAVKGHWFNIRFTPDLTDGETLNIGVGFVAEDRQVHAKLLSDFTCLHCLYGDRLDFDELQFLIDLLKQHWTYTGVPQSPPSSNIAFSVLKYAAGDSIEAILEELYQETVSLQPDSFAQRRANNNIRCIDTQAARVLVFEAMVRKAPLSAAMLATNPIWSVDGNKRLDMPIRAHHRFGTLISLWYQTTQTRELNTLRAQADLDAARRLFPDDVGGLFILRPPVGQPGYDQKQQQQINQVIEMTTWRLSMQHMRCEVEDDPDILAERVLRWSDMTAVHI